MSITGIDTVAVVVSDRHKAVEWYHRALGLDLAYIGPPEPSSDPAVQGTPEKAGHWVELGPKRPLSRIHICEASDCEVERGSTGITFLTDNILAEYERLNALGVRFLRPPRRMDWGEWLCSFQDPDGNEFDLKQPAAATLTGSRFPKHSHAM
ncbi:MAG TPA: VOC family protein [Candidatus Acidoferrales bacterium]|nr:VOC family protein [Candidatus Acidoferrales bacterium]